MEPTEEMWLPIPGYDGWYDVSSHGRVRSWLGCSTKRRRATPLIRVQNVDPRGGYRQVCLRRDGGQKTWPVYRLVALAFLGPKPQGMQVLHWDGDPSNNRLSNLRYGTPAENAEDAARLERQPRGSAHGMHVLIEDEVREIRRLHADGMTQTAIAERFSVHRSTVGLIVRNKKWTWLS